VWCDILSVTVGLMDIVVVATIGVCFVYIKVKSMSTEAAENEVVQMNISKKKRRLSSRELMVEMSTQHLQTKTQGTGEEKREEEVKDRDEVKDREDGEEGEVGEEGEEGGGKVIVPLGINPMHATHGGAAPTASETVTPYAARAHWNTLKQAMKTSRTFRNGGKQRMKRLSKVVKDVEAEGGGEVIVPLGINPMHAAHGETTPTAPKTATPNAARARWNKLKHATKTPRTFRNGGKQRMKRLSKVMKARHNEFIGGGGSSMEGEVQTVLDVEAAVSIHVDEKSGRRYSCNAATGHAQWFSDDDEEDKATIEEQGESTNTIRIVAFDFVGAESGEVDMQVGDEIELLGAINDDDDWGKGKNLRTGDVGDCPVRYLE
jgi:hypothetical protein